MALTAAPKDKFFPAETGIFAVAAKALDTSDKGQQWSYDMTEQTMSSHLHPGLVLTENESGIPFLYNSKNVNIQKFRFDLNNHHVGNPNTHHILTLAEHELWGDNAENLIFEKHDHGKMQKWEA